MGGSLSKTTDKKQVQLESQPQTEQQVNPSYQNGAPVVSSTSTSAVGSAETK